VIKPKKDHPWKRAMWPQKIYRNPRERNRRTHEEIESGAGNTKGIFENLERFSTEAATSYGNPPYAGLADWSRPRRRLRKILTGRVGRIVYLFGRAVPADGFVWNADRWVTDWESVAETTENAEKPVDVVCVPIPTDRLAPIDGRSVELTDKERQMLKRESRRQLAMIRGSHNGEG